MDRTAEMLGDLAASFENVLDFGRDVGYIDDVLFKEHWRTCWDALWEVANRQRRQLEAHDPASQFLSYLAAGFLSGKCHLTNRTQEAPDENPDRWGWSSQTRTEKQLLADVAAEGVR